MTNSLRYEKILIVGYGNIGKHIYQEFEKLSPDIYDKYKSLPLKGEECYDFAFICVPTDNLESGKCDISEVEAAINLIKAKTIIIKSTIPPTTTQQLIEKTSKNIIFSPEYYGVTQHCIESPDFVVLGGDKKLCSDVAQLYSKVKNGYYKFYFTDSTTAELAKYMLNSFLALKVTFCNEFADLARNFGVSYPELRELFVADSRISPSHTFVYEDKPYYDSHCFNKDVPALIQFAEGKAPLIESMVKINQNRKKQK